MKIIISVFLALVSTWAFSATLYPIQLLSPTGSTSGQALVSTGASTAPVWGTVPAGDLSPIAANTVLANATGSTATPTAVSMPSCSTSTSALQYTSGTGWSCYTNSASLTGSTFTGAVTIPSGNIDNTVIGGTTANTGKFTNLSASSSVFGAGFTALFASPTAIGSTAPASGSFTTLAASSTVSGSGFSTYLASPPPIGSTAPAAGSFTTLSANSTVSGTGFSTYLASPPAIGGTTPAAGKFTTLQATSAITPSSTAGIIGTATNDNSAVGAWGEYAIPSTAVTGISTAAPFNATSTSLAAGDYDVQCIMNMVPAATTVTTYAAIGVSSTSAAFETYPNSTILPVTFTANQAVSIPSPVVRRSLASTTTVYCVGQVNFSTSTMQAGAAIRWRRIR